jgi:hypothetical protein
MSTKKSIPKPPLISQDDKNILTDAANKIVAVERQKVVQQANQIEITHIDNRDDLSSVEKAAHKQLFRDLLGEGLSRTELEKALNRGKQDTA